MGVWTLVVVRTAGKSLAAEVASAAASTTRRGGHRPALRTGSHVIEARKLSLWNDRYDLIEDGRRVATWERSLWTTGGALELGGRRFTVRANLLGGESTMGEVGGPAIATAHGICRKNWTIDADGTTYHFRRAGLGRPEERLHDRGRRLGSVRRTGLWRGDAAADLPGLPRVVEVFAIALALSRWESDAAATG